MTTRVRSRLERVFNPRTLAVIGDKQISGYMWLRNNKDFAGKLYSVQIDEREIPGIEAMGIPNYKSLLDIPEDVDYAIIAVPRQVAPRVVQDCVAKGVGGCMLFTSGFAETEEEEGVHLQRTLAELARAGDLALIGPNCMGIHVPRLGIRHSPDQPVGPDAGGPVGFIAQSGTHAGFFTQAAPEHGIRISKSVSFGNAIVLDASDYLEYLAVDDETEIIGMYIEGVRDGRRFFETLRQTARRKPVVIWKGGQTEAGQRAIYSHTASLAAPMRIWDAMTKQVGAVSTNNLDETVDVMKALLHAKPATRMAAGLIAMTGGPSVGITDAFARAGFDVPRLHEGSYEKLSQFFNVIGGSYRNPFDAGGTIGMGGQPQNLDKLLEIIDEDDNIAVVAMDLGFGFAGRRWKERPEMLDAMLDTLAGFRDRSSKPLALILQPAHLEDLAVEMRRRVQERGFAVFASYERAADAMAKAIAYHRFRAELD
ncbi:MAG TPA: CoA-binding protein [Dehalococcoidia bacterium]|nr:CoA-binding protein [Dehalococcoidia bacterium]